MIRLKMSEKKHKVVCAIVFVIYLLVVLNITVVRIGVRYTERQMNLSLFSDFVNIYRDGGISLLIWLFVGNILWFVPFGFLLPIQFKRKSLVKVTTMGFAFSFTIESMQFLSRKGVAELDDLILNTLGVAIGYSVFALLRRLNVLAE